MVYKCLIVGLSIIGAGIVLHLFGCHHGLMKYHCHRKIRSMPDKIIGKISKACDLNPSQKNKLIAMKDTFAETHKSLLKQYEANMETVLAEIKKEEMNPDLLKMTFDEGIQKKREMHEKLLVQFVDFHASLSPQQKK